VTEPVLRSAPLAALTPRLLHDLLRLRVDVFVVEQACAYPELDGRDAEPTTVHWWAELDGAPVAVLRVLVDPDGSHRIGRVATAPSARGRGLARRLVEAALRDLDGPVVLDAQDQLVPFYADLGFVVSGAGFVEDGIPHTPMRRAPTG
jgi:ElaA protein